MRANGPQALPGGAPVKCPHAVGIVAGGGSPCQGLRRLSSTRDHLNDPRSKLFFEAVRIFKMMDAEAAWRNLWTLKLLENVVADLEDIQEMSDALKMRCRFSGRKAGAREPDVRFPTFTRAIPRKKPPPSSAGLRSSLPGPVNERRAEDGYRYPPYTGEVHDLDRSRHPKAL